MVFNKTKDKALCFSSGTIRLTQSFSGIECHIHAWVRKFTRVEATAGKGWKIVSYETIYDGDAIVPTNPCTHVPYIDTTGFRESYKYITWALKQKGFDISQDRLGTEREETVKAAFNEAYEWLNHDSSTKASVR